MKYSIVIPTYNHLEDLLKPCLESIIKHTNLREVEIIVICNGCVDGSEEYVKSLGSPFKCIVIEKAIGYAKSTNIGIEEAEGEFIVLLNNDTILLEQEQNAWLDIMEEPFEDSNVGITGPIKSYSPEAERYFVIFFCAMMRRSLFDEVGLLDEIFTPGGGEDMDFCMRAEDFGYTSVQVPVGEPNILVDNLLVNSYPIFHHGEKTVDELDDWKGVFAKNMYIIQKRHNYQEKFHNNYERAAYNNADSIGVRERARYEWANSKLKGNTVLELGCSNGYGNLILDNNLEYTGYDYSEDIINEAKKQFPDKEFKVFNLEEEKIVGFWDTIIAFEVLEHLDNGLELAQELKNHCNTLLVSVPYKEPKGLWGKHHKLHGLSEVDFSGFSFKHMDIMGNITDSPQGEIGLMIGKWNKQDVLCFIPTKDRYFSTLPLAIQGVLNQTIKPDELIIYDDSIEKIDLRDNGIYSILFDMLTKKGIEWEVVYGCGRGQHFGHQISNISEYKLVWRLDDDNVPEDNVLETLLSKMRDEIGAVAGKVLSPEYTYLKDNFVDSFEDNIQWYDFNGDHIVEHLYSSFLYRAGIVNYELGLSKVAHREETIFTQRLCAAGCYLLVTGDCTTWHYRNPEGGIRTGVEDDWMHDECIFQELQQRDRGVLTVYLDSGMGDHVCFNSVLPDLKEKYKKIRIFSCYPELIDLPSESIAEGQKVTCPDFHNIYKFMTDFNWKGELKYAYEKMYLS